MRTLLFVCLTILTTIVSGYGGEAIRIGSKKFTESVILGELAARLAKTKNARVKHLRELGGTRVLWNALVNGDIDLYPEYTGTLLQEIFSRQHLTSQTQLPALLEKFGVKMSQPLGFNNTYALGMKKQTAGKLNVTRISDLVNYPQLRFGFTNEFMDRADGWRSLQRFYRLPQQDVRGLDHDLAYRGLASGSIDLTDLYSTDAEIRYYNLQVLQDDRHFFKDYFAVFLYRQDLPTKAPEALTAILQLAGRISESQMIALNARVKINGVSESRVASEFIEKHLQISSSFREETIRDRFFHNTRNHLILVLISLSAAIFISIPLGIWAFRNRKLGQVILAVVGVIQTIPSLALLVFMIPLLGIGARPAIVALFLYSLLPIVRNTYAGLHDIPDSIRESAIALGLPAFARLRLVELPLAARAIIAGIKTSAVINVGTATLGALIGAGGYGQPILTGIRLDNVGLILEGAIPAALLALLVQGFFELSEKWLVPKGLRLKPVNTVR